MSRLGRGLISGAAGLASVGIGFHLGDVPPITDQAIESCATAIEGLSQEVRHLPPECDQRGIERAFYVDSAKTPSSPFDIILPTPDELRDAAHEVQAHDNSRRGLRIGGSLIIGAAAFGVTYHELAALTKKKQQSHNPQATE